MKGNQNTGTEAALLKAAIYTLGCKVNQYESRMIGEMLEQNGYSIVDSKEDADIYIVNSCTVTAAADQKTRQHVRKLKREHPQSVVVLTGCMTQAFPDDANRLPEADIVLGNKNNHKLLQLLDTYTKFGKRIVSIEPHKTGDAFVSGIVHTYDERTRAIIKIQDGCNRFCSYCIIPYSRGRVRSKPLAELKAEVQALSDNGYREVVLVGINLSSYGQDIGCTFPDAVRCACSVDGISRVRLGSLEPDHLTETVIAQLASLEKLCPQFHISLQSGCDRTLRRMNRHYTTQEFRSLCDNLRKQFKDCTLTTDIMVGFCGETQEDFEESLRFVEEIGFEKLHVFPYSVREGTKAANMPDHLPKAVKEERAAQMLRLGEALRQQFFRSCVGKNERVLLESTRKNGYLFGYTANYLPVLLQKEDAVCGDLVDVKITGVTQDAVLAEPIK